MKRILILTLLIVTLGISVSAQIITNGSFEDLATNDPCNGNVLIFPSLGTLFGWEVGAEYVIAYCSWQASHGEISVRLNTFSGSPGSIYQDVPTVAGVIYEVTFDVSSLGSPGTRTMSVTANGNPAVHYEYIDSGNTFDNMNWSPRVYRFTAAGPTTRLTFASTTSGSNAPFIDNVIANPRVGMVCHTNNGNGQPRTLNLTEGWAFWAHTQHGDQIGACP